MTIKLLKEKCIKGDEQQFVLLFILSLVARLYFYISVWCATFIHFIAWIKTSILQVSFQPWGMLTSMFTGCKSVKSPDIHLTVPVQLRWRLVVVVKSATWTCLRDCGCSLNSTGASWPEYYAHFNHLSTGVVTSWPRYASFTNWFCIADVKTSLSLDSLWLFVNYPSSFNVVHATEAKEAQERTGL